MRRAPRRRFRSLAPRLGRRRRQWRRRRLRQRQRQPPRRLLRRHLRLHPRPGRPPTVSPPIPDREPAAGRRKEPPPTPSKPTLQESPPPLPPPPLARSRDDADPLDPAPAAPREQGRPSPVRPALRPPSLYPSPGRFSEGSAESGDRSLGAKRRSRNKVRGSRPAGPGGPQEPWGSGTRAGRGCPATRRPAGSMPLRAGGAGLNWPSRGLSLHPRAPQMRPRRGPPVA